MNHAYPAPALLYSEDVMSSTTMIAIVSDAIIDRMCADMMKRMAGVTGLFKRYRRAAITMFEPIKIADIILEIMDRIPRHHWPTLRGMLSMVIRVEKRYNSFAAVFRFYEDLPLAIVLYPDKADLKALADHYSMGASIASMRAEFTKTVGNSVCHEMTHACDHVKSRGKFVLNTRSAAHQTARNSGTANQYYKYLRNPIEINAQFTAALVRNQFKPAATFDDFVALVKPDVAAWSYLTLPEEKRLLSRAMIYWTELQPVVAAGTSHRPTRQHET